MDLTKLKEYRAGLSIAGLLLISIIAYQIFNVFFVYENDAFIEANLIQVASEVSGHVKSIHVHDLAHVNKGDVLYQIDPKPYQDKVNLAKANLKVATDRYNSLRYALIAAKKKHLIAQEALTFQSQQLKRY